MSKKIIKFLVLGLSLLFLSSSACASEIGRITAIEGKVDILKAGADETVPAGGSDVISDGDIIRTKSRSKAEIKFGDDTVLTLAQNTRLNIEEYMLSEFGFRSNATINVQRGEIKAEILKTIGEPNFFINTPNASGVAGDSDIFVFYNKSATGILVNKGSASMHNNAFPEKAVDVSGGFMTVVQADRPPQDPRPYLDVEKNRHEAETTVLRPRTIDDPSQIKAIVTKLFGSVNVRYAGTEAWAVLKLSEILVTGDRIETKENGMAEITLDNGNIITIKPNSSLILTELSRDSETGDYVNLFKANIGNIRAKVEKLRGDSKFEIVTPTATAGVRGTTLYLQILPGLTKVFFEGGTGAVTSLISNITKIVQDGQTASADDQGNVSDPVDATDTEKSEWAGGWEPPEAEPYEEPGEGGTGEGGDVGDLGDPGEGETGEGGEIPDIPDTTGGEPVVDVPPEPDETTTTTQEEEEEEPPLTFSGVWGERELEGSLYDNDSGSLALVDEEYGVIGSTTPNWWTEESFPVLVIGGYDYNEEAAPEPYIWNTPIYSYNVEDETYATRDGGAFFGFTHGIWKDEVMDGYAVAFHLDPDGNIGYLLGSLLGSYFPLDIDEDNNLWTAAGLLTPEALGSTNISPASFVGSITAEAPINVWVSGSFNGQGNIEGGGQGHAYYVNDGKDTLPWALFNLTFGDGNTYNNPDPEASTTWSGVIGGYDEEGDRNYWLAEIENGTWDNNEPRADISGIHLTDETLRILGGNIFGIEDGEYNEDEESYTGSWIATSIGTSIERDLTFTGLWGEEATSLYYNDGGYIDTAGEEFGLLGAVTPDWWAQESFRVIAMGEYYDWESEPYIWNTEIESYDAVGDDDTTIDGGAFLGTTAGIWNDDTIYGSAVVIYVDPYGNAGLLTGHDLSGNYYPLDEYGEGASWGMWQTEGRFTPIQMVSAEELGVAPEDFSQNIKDGYLDAYVYDGFFSYDEGYIVAEDWGSWGGTTFIDNGEMSQPWGIYDLKLQRPVFSEYPYSYYNPYDSTTWFAFIQGEGEFGYREEGGDFWQGGMGGVWKDGEILGSLSALYITYENNAGLIIGDVFGLYDEDETVDYYGTWIGESIGTFTEIGHTEIGDLDTFELIGEGLSSFDEGGSLEDIYMEGAALYILDQDWGIWSADFEADYYNPAELENWTGGLVMDMGEGFPLLGLVDGTDSPDDQILRLDYTLYSFDSLYEPEELQTFSGTSIGTYDPYNIYEGVGTGVYYWEPLTFSGYWREEMSSLYFNNNGQFGLAGEEYGVIGLTTPDWWLEESFPIVAIGKYDAPEGRYIWNTPIEGYSIPSDSGLFGYTAGVWNEYRMDGSVVALYVAPADEPNMYDVGFLRGDVEGAYYDDIYMWMTEGSLVPIFIETCAAEKVINFPYEDVYDESTFRISGDFNGAGSIEGYTELERTYLAYEHADWGIYNLKFGDGRSIYNNPDPEANTNWSGVMGSIEDDEWEISYFLADISDGTWEDGEIKADVDGTYIAIAQKAGGESFLGRLEGDFYGVNDIDSTWIGTTIGTWVEEPLEYGGEAEGAFGYVEDGEVIFDSGNIFFIFGGTEPIEDDFAPVTIIGEYKNPGDHTLWGSEFEDWISDETKVLATAGGINLDGLLEGVVIGLYIRDAGAGGYRVGYMSSSDEEGNFSTIKGNFYDGIGMFNAAGNLTAYYDSPTSITPAQLYIDEENPDHPVEISYQDGLISGDFSGIIGVESLELDGQDWGIWRAGLSGEGGPNSPFTLAVAGSSEFNDCWLGTASGDGESGKMWGTFKGVSLYAEEENTIGASAIRGNIIGTYIDVDDELGTDSWQALGVGEWVDVTDLLTEDNLGFTMEELQNFIVEVPITETYASLLTGSQGFITSAAMDISLYNDWLWTALIYGMYNPANQPTLEDQRWSLILNDVDDIDNVTLQGSQWSENEWLAGVNGVVGGNNITGEAGGSYGDGEFQGVGAGTTIEQ